MREPQQPPEIFGNAPIQSLIGKLQPSDPAGRAADRDAVPCGDGGGRVPVESSGASERIHDDKQDLAVPREARIGAGVWHRAVEQSGASRMRNISLSPLCHGCDVTGQLSVSLAASTVAAATFNDRDTEPSRAMKSTAWPAIPVWGERATFTVPVAPEPGSHAMRSMVVVAPLASANDAGLSTPFAPSAATALPTVTGSKNNSCSTPSGALTVTVQSWRNVYPSQSRNIPPCH